MQECKEGHYSDHPGANQCKARMGSMRCSHAVPIRAAFTRLTPLPGCCLFKAGLQCREGSRAGNRPRGCAWPPVPGSVQACPPGTSSSRRGARSASACQPCSPGTHQELPGAAECKVGSRRRGLPRSTWPHGGHCRLQHRAHLVVPAANNRFASHPPCCLCSFPPRLRVPAQACPAGRYVEAAGARFCRSCPAGTYTSTPGSIACRPCQRGTASEVQGSSTALLCQDCSPGYYQDEPGMQACKVGKTQSGRAVLVPANSRLLCSGSCPRRATASRHVTCRGRPCSKLSRLVCYHTEPTTCPAGLSGRHRGARVWLNRAAGLQGATTCFCAGCQQAFPACCPDSAAGGWAWLAQPSTPAVGALHSSPPKPCYAGAYKGTHTPPWTASLLQRCAELAGLESRFQSIADEKQRAAVQRACSEA